MQRFSRKFHYTTKAFQARTTFPLTFSHIPHGQLTLVDSTRFYKAFKPSKYLDPRTHDQYSENAMQQGVYRMWVRRKGLVEPC